MEDFAQIKKISPEEAKKILPKDIAYLTMKNGEIIVVNGLNHEKFDKKQKEFNNNYDDYDNYDIKYKEKQNKNNINNINNNLFLFKEDTEENERNSNLFNQQNNPSYNNISQNNHNKNYNYIIKRNNVDKYNNYNNHSYTEIIATKKGKK